MKRGGPRAIGTVTDVNYPFCIAGEKRSSLARAQLLPRGQARTYRPIVHAAHPRSSGSACVLSRLRLARSRQSEGALDFDRPYCRLFARIFLLKSADPLMRRCADGITTGREEYTHCDGTLLQSRHMCMYLERSPEVFSLNPLFKL